ncbi:TRAP transporter, 4TM/12TM fusion protein [Tepidanaerobacter acetatoxydans Re1]|uniref:TRAP transporter, 4TM/12TM fusion protein n=1 Tax=Tepidanaerobacter acetatoxydans (strain DSM 21804 / JCM 16047 / Re1) TaxID=1209989 RepID=F4LSJ9_TEPAE|nr:TRAP transporter fused permease subunit [Tepidanaerobacter acetatoxydans]AEE92389.1 TRAP transporter, 4TM/12TM fusion protein [Tepidanaerobacter acetatoxydans Re1]CCP27288.1 TRAP transporter, 4TM/12TM fusion protein [Tepidanaerobacter acetatoxydans Re1]
MRKLTGFWKSVVTALSISLVIFQLYTSGFGAFPDIVQRSVHLFFVLTLCFILKPMHKGKDLDKVPIIDIVLSILAAASTLYMFLNYQKILWDPLQWISTLDKFFAVVLVILVLEASRRTVGLTFPIMAVILLVYAYFGEYFPGMWGHQQFSFNYIFQNFYHSTNGIWGTMVGLSATMLAMFGIFGSVLSATGGSETFVKLGQICTGKAVGGPGKVALIASGLFGMISGSAMANVVATGTFTIPLMKKSRYSNEWAAAISAVGSTGGQIMPPMMGAGAFIMAQLISVPYLKIAVSAIIPALLYYLGAFVAIHFISLKLQIRGEAMKEKILFTEYAIIFVPIAIFVFFLIKAYTVTVAAFYATIGAIITCAACYFLKTKSISRAAKDTGALCFDVSLKGAASILDMASLLAGSQITISLISMTGVGVKLSDLIVSIGQNNMFLCLFLSMCVCIILGMGLPTTAAYVLAAAILAPALISLELSPLIAHLFVFYFSTLATITPPVCAAVFLSSGIAEANWLKTGWLSCLIAIPAFVVPYTFSYNPALLLMGNPYNIIVGTITAVIGVVFTGIAIAGYTNKDMSIIARSTMFLGGILLLIPNLMWSIIGLVICCISFFISSNAGKKKEEGVA